MDMDRVWREYHDELRGFVAKRVNDPAVADDIVQDVFLRVLEKRDSLRSGEKLRGWLYRIARNAIVDHYRARRPQEELPDSLAAAAEEEDEERARNDIGRCLAPMVSHLPAGYREAVVLSELEGKSQKEVAALQGLSLSGAKSRVQRGRALLRDMILECCRVEFDGRGRAIDYETRGGGPCGGETCGPPS
ncbi:MAG: RNA polymerase sigma factor SigZ [Deltaproteobacteria bacterium]|nr:RNA polymerase sigma factor SigZ [Deltaproteobacteria bacterium]